MENVALKVKFTLSPNLCQEVYRKVMKIIGYKKYLRLLCFFIKPWNN